MITALIIDDEPLARRALKEYLKPSVDVEIIAECNDGFEGLRAIQKHQPQLIFLDIQMPKINGFEMLELVEQPIGVIFTTAFDEFALKAFEVKALDYLLKPVDPERLKETIQKVQLPEEEFATKLNPLPAQKEKVLQAGDKIFIKDGEKCWCIDIAEVRMIESDGNYVKVYFDRFRPLILRSLNSLEDRLDPKLFFRANRKFIINLNWISGIENWFNGGLQVSLKDGEKVEISRRQAIRFKELMSL